MLSIHLLVFTFIKDIYNEKLIKTSDDCTCALNQMWNHMKVTATFINYFLVFAKINHYSIGQDPYW